MGEENQHINYSAADIEKYLKGKLLPAERHAMEKAALDDPFLADAMEGFGEPIEKDTAANYDTQQNIAELKQRLADRINEQEKTPVIGFGWWKIAAAVILLIGAGWVFTQINNKSEKQNVAKAGELKKEQQPVIIKADSAKSFIQPAVTDKDTLNDIAINRAVGQDRTRRGIAVEKKPVLPVYNQSKETLRDSVAVNASIAKNEEADKKINQLPAVAAPELRVVTVQKDEFKKQADKENGLAARNNVGNNAGFAFNGQVTDQLNKPLAGASVQVQGSNLTTITDNNGYFSLKAPDTTVSVSVASVGFELQNISLQNNNAGPAANQVKLKTAGSSLNEVVVTGYGTKKKQSLLTKDLSVKIQDAEPVISLEEYDQYLEKNKRIADDAKNIHNSVVVSFDVRSKGLNNFRIEQSSNNKSLDQEAIRLIKDGPAWKLLKGKKASVTYLVKF